MAFNHDYVDPGGTGEYSFNNVTIQGTATSYFPPQGRSITEQFNDSSIRDVTQFSKPTMPAHCEDILWENKFVNASDGRYAQTNETSKYFHVDDSSKYAQLTEGLKYGQVNDSPKYIHVNESPKYIYVTESPKYVHVNESPKYINANSVGESPKYIQLTDVGNTVSYSVLTGYGNVSSVVGGADFTALPDTTKYGSVTTVVQADSIKRDGTVIKREHRCNLCQRVLSSGGALKTHMLIHSDTKQFVCHICDKRFASSTGHQRHIINHAGIRQHKCETCDKTFVLKTALRQHEKIHEGLKKPYKCDICQCSFRFPFRLKEHQRTHTGERPFACNICGKSFRVNRLLAKHKDIHNGKVKKYNTCYKRTKAVPKECSICHHKFADLKQHLETHSNARCYKCHICDKKFKRRSYAQTHMRRAHSHKQPLSSVEQIAGDESEKSANDTEDAEEELDKTFSCDECSRMFALEWSLTMHKTLVHKVKSKDQT